MTLQVQVGGVPQSAGSESSVQVYLSNLGQSSARTMVDALRIASKVLGNPNPLTVDWDAIRWRDASAVRAALLNSQYSAATANRVLAAVRGVAKVSFQLGRLPAAAWVRVSAVPNLPQGQAPGRGRHLSEEEVVQLFAAVQASSNGRRLAAILAVFLGTGLRRAELVALDVDDICTATGSVDVRRGKGGKPRRVWMSESALGYVRRWLAVRGRGAGYLFCRVGRGGTPRPAMGLSTQRVYAALRDLGDLAGLDHFSPHDLRRTFVGNLLDHGVDVCTVQRLAGHSYVSTTALYDRRPDRASREAAQSIELPRGL